MEEREELAIFLVERPGYIRFDWKRDQGDVRGAMDLVSTFFIGKMHVDTLTDKQREALMFIRMLPEREYVEGIGAWVKSRVQPGNVYIIDCS